jgi:hypothetical protein
MLSILEEGLDSPCRIAFSNHYITQAENLEIGRKVTGLSFRD